MKINEFFNFEKKNHIISINFTILPLKYYFNSGYTNIQVSELLLKNRLWIDFHKLVLKQSLIKTEVQLI